MLGQAEAIGECRTDNQSVGWKIVSRIEIFLSLDTFRASADGITASLYQGTLYFFARSMVFEMFPLLAGVVIDDFTIRLDDGDTQVRNQVSGNVFLKRVYVQSSRVGQVIL